MTFLVVRSQTNQPPGFHPQALWVVTTHGQQVASLRGFYSSVEVRSVYSTAPANWVVPMRRLNITLNYLMVRLHSWSFGKCGVHFNCHYFQVHKPGVIISVRVPSMGQIELFINMNNLIKPELLVLDSNTWSQLTVYKLKSFGLFKKEILSTNYSLKNHVKTGFGLSHQELIYH